MNFARFTIAVTGLFTAFLQYKVLSKHGSQKVLKLLMAALDGRSRFPVSLYLKDFTGFI